MLKQIVWKILKIINKAPITINPKNISYGTIFFLKIIGSIKAINNADEDMHTSATDTLDTLIAIKKVAQCTAIIIPIPKNFNNVRVSTLKETLRITINTANPRKAIPILTQANGAPSNESINLPKTPVNPHINMMKWSLR